MLSRDSQGPKAKALSDIGIPVAAANSWNKDALLMAFEGCWGLFMNIDSDSPVQFLAHIVIMVEHGCLTF